MARKDVTNGMVVDDLEDANDNFIELYAAQEALAAGSGVVTSETGDTVGTLDGKTKAGDNITLEVVDDGGVWKLQITGADSVQSITPETKSAEYTLLAADRGKVFECSGTFSLNFTAAATLTSGWFCWLTKPDAGTITYVPDGAETISEATMVYAQKWALIYCDGTGFKVIRPPYISDDVTTTTTASSDAYIDFTIDPDSTYEYVINQIKPVTADVNVVFTFLDVSDAEVNAIVQDSNGIVFNGSTPTILLGVQSKLTIGYRVGNANEDKSLKGYMYSDPSKFESVTWGKSNAGAMQHGEWNSLYNSSLSSVVTHRFSCSSGNILSGTITQIKKGSQQ